MIFLKSKDEIQMMRKAGAIVAEILCRLEEVMKPGMATNDLDELAEKWIREKKAIPTFLGYQNYPKTLCVSINEEVVHGIPGDRILKEGDLISIDCGVTYEGFVGDHAKTFCLGKVDDNRKTLVQETERSLHAGIAAFQIGNRIGDIGVAVESVAKEFQYGLVKDFVGHGVGKRMHEEPQVPNFGEPGTGPRLKQGLVLAIEPMFNLGSEKVKILEDGWTVITSDNKHSAHFEHTIALTENGPQILTVP